MSSALHRDFKFERAWLLGVSLATSAVPGATACSGDPVYIDLSIRGKPAPAPAAQPVCWSDTDCGPAKPFCNPASRTCVECLEGTACSKGAKLICEPVAGICVECLFDTDCSGARPYCQIATMQCVECLAKTDCGDPARACQPGTSRCVPICASAADCKAPTAVCSPRFEVCVECETSADCADVKKPICNADEGRCAAAPKAA